MDQNNDLERLKQLRTQLSRSESIEQQINQRESQIEEYRKRMNEPFSDYLPTNISEKYCDDLKSQRKERIESRVKNINIILIILSVILVVGAFIYLGITNNLDTGPIVMLIWLTVPLIVFVPVVRKEERLSVIVTVIALILTIGLCVLSFVLTTAGNKPVDLNNKTDSLKSGDKLSFGKIEQDGITDNGAEDIEWIVLSVNGNEVLAISKDVLSIQTFSPNEGMMSDPQAYEDSSVKTWIDTVFLSSFSAEDQKKILDVSLPTKAMADAIKSCKAYKAKPTEIAKSEYKEATGYEWSKISKNNYESFWLKDTDKGLAYSSDHITGYYMNSEGSIKESSFNDIDMNGVRPVIKFLINDPKTTESEDAKQ